MVAAVQGLIGRQVTGWDQNESGRERVGLGLGHTTSSAAVRLRAIGRHHLYVAG
jgi:hypothetical protein